MEEGGVPTPKILVSDRVQLLMPYHVLQDTYEEERLAGRAFGSTRSGIAPFYSDKYAKIGIQLNELFDEAVLRERLEKICTLKNVLFTHLYHKPELKVDELFDQLMEWREVIKPYMADTQRFVTEALPRARPSSWRVSWAPCATPTSASTPTPPPLIPWRASAAWAWACRPRP